MNLKGFNKTFIKYFISYFLIVIVLIGIFFLIYRKNFMDIYQDNLQDSVKKRMESIQATLDSEIMSFVLLDGQIKKDLNLIMSNYVNPAYELYQANKKITTYDIANNLIDSISVISDDGEVVLSTAIPVLSSEDGYSVFMGGVKYPIPLEEYRKDFGRRFFRLNTGGKSFLIYLSQASRKSRFCTLYILNRQEFDKILNVDDGREDVTFLLLAPDGSLLAGGEEDEVLSVAGLLSDTGWSPDTLGLYELDNFNSVYVTAGNSDSGGKLVLLALISNKRIDSLVRQAMGKETIAFVLVFLFSLPVIMIAMQVTFQPLQRLIQKIVPFGQKEHNYIDLLEDTFSNLSSEKYALQEKLNNYQKMMKKSLFDSVIQSPFADHSYMNDIDLLFSMEPEQCVVYLVKIMNKREDSGFSEQMRKCIYEGLGNIEKKMVVLIETQKEYDVFLLSYHRNDMEASVTSILDKLQTAFGHTYICSEKADSPMDIPALYRCITGEDDGQLQYPVDKLERLTDDLKSSCFTEAEECIKEILRVLEHISDSNTNPFIDFYGRSILIDILTILTSAISEYNVKFKEYSDLYYSTLYLCRSCSYEEHKAEILCNMLELLRVCRKNVTAGFRQIEEIVDAEYLSPDFSITVLADAFHISTAHMSFLFKQRFGKNFSEYLWNMRARKAMSLLTETDQTVDQIAASVGYVNVSSFRRKFKQEMGVSPSEYREGHIRRKQ